MVTLKAGDKAPDFAASDENGKEVKLSDYLGKKAVLYFYPKDDTEACTAEACSLRDNYSALKKAGYEIIGVSSDTPRKHSKFKTKYKLPFRLVADTDLKVNELYGTWIEKMMYRRKYMGTQRITFIINEKGAIQEVMDKVNTAHHALQILGKPIPTKVP